MVDYNYPGPPRRTVVNTHCIHPFQRGSCCLVEPSVQVGLHLILPQCLATSRCGLATSELLFTRCDDVLVQRTSVTRKPPTPAFLKKARKSCVSAPKPYALGPSVAKAKMSRSPSNQNESQGPKETSEVVLPRAPHQLSSSACCRYTRARLCPDSATAIVRGAYPRHVLMLGA